MHKELNNLNDKEIISEEINDNLDKDEIFNLFFNNFKKTNNSIISNLFYGIYEIKYQCNTCRETNYNYESFSFIELNLEKKVPLRFQKQDSWPMEININLIDCFDFNKSDHYVIEENKANCKCGNKIKKYLKNLFSMPNYLIIFLKRIDNNIYKINYPEKFMRYDAKNLLQKILVKNPNKRINVNQIKKHKFYLMGKDIYSKNYLKINTLKN